MADRGNEKKDYCAPKIVHTEVLTGRAVVCAKADDTACAAGPVQS